LALPRDRLCGVVAAPTAPEMIQLLRRGLLRTSTLELRLDWLANEAEVVRFLGWLGRQRLRATLIATCRRREAGGKYRGDVASQVAVLRLAVACGCTAVDVEMESAERFTADALRGLLPIPRIISYHNFRRTPAAAALRAIVRRLEQCGGDAVKVAAECRSLGDSVRVLQLARRARRVVTVPMGETGLPARILALRHGSALAYAAVGEASAPGQISLEAMQEMYRTEGLNARTRVYGVIGNPVAHSLSPLMHNAAFAARGVNAVYLPFRVARLEDFLGAAGKLGVAGFSVTLPHKERILRRLDDCDPLAADIGAVNTVVVRARGKLYGYNTDYVGVLRALERRMRLRGSRVLLYGAGGAARAVAFALSRAGAIVCVCARRTHQAVALARAVGGEAVARRRLAREFFDAIVNCTPVGMHPRESESPLAAREINAGLVFDLIYRPQRTRLLHLAARRGIECVSGVEMFLAQGMAQWEIWMGQRAPEKVMRAAVMEALREEVRK